MRLRVCLLLRIWGWGRLRFSFKGRLGFGVWGVAFSYHGEGTKEMETLCHKSFVGMVIYGVEHFGIATTDYCPSRGSRLGSVIAASCGKRYSGSNELISRFSGLKGSKCPKTGVWVPNIC